MFKKGTSKIIVWLNLLFIILALGTEVYLFIYEEFNALNIIYGAIDAVLLVEAFLYLVTGRKKNSAGYFKTFSILYAVRIFINAVFSGVLTKVFYLSYFPEYTQVLTNLFTVLPLVPATMIATCKDLGKKKSYALIGIVYVVYLIPFLFSLIRPFGNVTTIDQNLFFYIARPGLLALLTSLLGIMVVEKYQDKASRNTD